MEEDKDFVPKVPLIRFTRAMVPQTIADSIIRGINEGVLDPLEVAVGFKKLKKVIDKVFDSKQGNKDCREARDEQAKLYAPKGTADAFGAKVAYTATNTSYNYKASMNTKYNKLARIAKQVKAEMDDIQKMLLKLPEAGEEITIDEMPMLTWEASGELITIYPPEKKQSFGTKITL